jgi:hypothetical protein
MFARVEVPNHDMTEGASLRSRSDGRRYEAVLRLSEALSAYQETEGQCADPGRRSSNQRQPRRPLVHVLRF